VLGPACAGKNAALVPMTDGERTNIVNAHNSLRSKVALGNETLGKEGYQPKAANMLALGRFIQSVLNYKTNSLKINLNSSL